MLLTHVRVTCALMIREVSTRYGGKPGGYLWALLDPVAHIVIMTVIFGAIARMPALGSSFSLFFATGYLPFMFFQTMQAYVSGAIKANKGLLSYPVVSPFDTVTARYLVQAFTSFAIAIAVFEVIVLEDGITLDINYGALVGSCLLASFLGLGIGLINIFMYARYPVYEQLFSLFIRPMSLISGMFFLPDSMPHPYQDFLLYNPLCHIIILFRESVYREYRGTGLDTDYLLLFTTGCLVVGALLFTFGSKTIRED